MSDARPFEILPAIDLRGGRVVRLRQGDFDRETAFSDDPVDIAGSFAAVGASWIHVVDLDGARVGVRAHKDVIAAILVGLRDRARIEVAGGLRDETAVADVLESGATRAVIGTAALQDPAFAGRLVSKHGADRIAVAIDVRGGRDIGHGWAASAAGLNPVNAIERLADVGVTTFEVTAIDRDGLLAGPDLALYERVIELDRGAIIASGGIASLGDLADVRARGCAGAILGRALYEGRLDLATVIDWGKAGDAR